MPQPSTNYTTMKHWLGLGLVLNGCVIAIEFIGGYLINSIGLMSDAGHNLIDQGSLFLALYAHILAARPATADRTFGYHRAGIIAAFVNGFALLVTAALLAYFAIVRIMTPVPVPGGWVMAIALGCFLANLGVAWLLKRGAQDDLNIRGAFWHMLADAWVSLGVVASGVGIYFTSWTVLDPLISLVIVGVIIKGAWPVFRESLDILLESTPPGIKTSHIIQAIERLDGVKNVHDLHIWAVEPRLVMLTCHVMVAEDRAYLKDALLSTIRSKVAAEFGIRHLTIQLETECAHTDTVHCDLHQLANGGTHTESHPRHHHSAR